MQRHGKIRMGEKVRMVKKVKDNWHLYTIGIGKETKTWYECIHQEQLYSPPTFLIQLCVD